MATQAQSQGRYAVINTLLDTTDVTLIDSLSGRQGDNGRIVYFAIKDGNLPHNLDGQNVVLTAKDSAGKVKQISGVNDIISATGGLFSMLIPGEMYQSAGDIEEAYISVQDGAGTVISSIPVTFTVLANNILFTANASKDYIDSVQQAIDEANSRISGLNDSIKAQQLVYETLNTSVGNLSGQVNSNQVALLNVANHFTDTATFDKGIVTPKFKADSVKAQQSHDGNTWHNLADDDAVVHNTGNETIGGDKTFTGNVNFSGDTDWIAVPISINGTGEIKYRRRLGFVEVYARYIPTTASTGTIKPLTLPTGFRPVGDIREFGMNGGAIKSDSSRIMIGTDGVVEIGAEPTFYANTIVRLHTIFSAS